MEDVVYLVLDVHHRVNVSHYRDLESLLAAMCDDYEHETMIGVEAPLIEEQGCDKNG